mmetsp:Transcript_55307/g.145891  ORF Transcript_55307/g.145891 Transcript_55307/m.145891 type:complete len:93 (+) Transcript_55307:672-950(+)
MIFLILGDPCLSRFPSFSSLILSDMRLMFTVRTPCSPYTSSLFSQGLSLELQPDGEQRCCDVKEKGLWQERPALLVVVHVVTTPTFNLKLQF